MYPDRNYKTKKQLKEAIASGKEVYVYQPNNMFGNAKTDGDVSVEGPHYPEPHKWYACVRIENSKIVKVLS